MSYVTRFGLGVFFLSMIGCGGETAPNPQSDCRREGFGCGEGFVCQATASGNFNCVADTQSGDAMRSSDAGMLADVQPPMADVAQADAMVADEEETGTNYEPELICEPLCRRMFYECQDDCQDLDAAMTLCIENCNPDVLTPEYASTLLDPETPCGTVELGLAYVLRGTTGDLGIILRDCGEN